MAFSHYPTGSSKNQHHISCHKYIEHFLTGDGVIYYCAVGTTKVSKLTSCPDKS